MKYSIFKNILFSFVAVVLFFVILNFLCWLVPGDYYRKLQFVDAKMSQSVYGYFRPNQSRDILFPGLEPYHVTINALGLRTVGEDFTADTLSRYETKILTLGDSHTFGLFVDDEASYPYQLQQIVKQNNKPAVVLNAGIGGSTITDYSDYLIRKGLSIQPDVVVLNFCGNDLPEMDREISMYEGVLKKSQVPFVKRLKRTRLARMFFKVYIDYKYNRWLSKVKDERAREILKTKSREMNDVLYAFEAYHAGRVLTDPFNDELKPKWDRYLNELNKTIALLKENDIPLVVFFPAEILSVMDSGRSDYVQYVKGLLMANGVEYIDLVSVFAERKGNVLSLYNNPPRDFHLSGEGNAVLAEQVYDRLRGLGILK